MAGEFWLSEAQWGVIEPASPKEPAGRAQDGRPAGDQLDRSRSEGRLPLAGLPARLWSADDDLQSVPSLDDARPVAAAI